MLLADRRIELDARPAPGLRAAVEVVMLGHCPGEVRWQRLAADRALQAEIFSLGFHAEMTRLRELAAGAPPGDGDAELTELYRLPLPVYSLGQFQDLFPGAFREPTRYQSRLAGDRAWLPLAVQDFFENSAPLPDGAKKLWVIRVDEAPQAGAVDQPQLPFLPRENEGLLDVAALGAFERALLVPGAGIIALPDLERVQIPANLPDIPRVRLPNPEPVFLPCGAGSDDGHRERRNPDEMPNAPEPLALEAVVGPIVRALRRLRPDVQCLLALPLDEAPGGERPACSGAALAGLHQLAGEEVEEEGTGLFRIQFLYPYLRGPDRALASPSGLVAGAQAEVSARQGPWRSMAGRPLPGRSLPYPPVRQDEATRLREGYGVSVLLGRNGRVELDDERLAAPAVPGWGFGRRVFPEPAEEGCAGAGLPLPAFRQAADYQSGEIARFLGWLRRELTALGERLVFDVDPRDPRPLLALRAFFEQLHRLGALRGGLPEQAFRVEQRAMEESRVILDVEIAPSFPIDRLRITFVHNRNSDRSAPEIAVTRGRA